MKKLSKLTTIILYLLVISIILSLFLIKSFSTKIKPSLIKYGEVETKRIITLIINDSISKFSQEHQNINTILNIEKDSENKIKTIDFNPQKVTKIQNSINKNIEKNLIAIEKGELNNINININRVSDIEYEEIKKGLIYYIPMGNITGSLLTNNIGPKIPIKFSTTGDITSNIESKVKEYGINNALIEVNIKVSVTMIISMPFISKEVTVTNKIPLFIKIIQGELPNYYLSNNNS
jgi:sporulation protein YunB